ncbi:MAG: hypothetical protein COV45_04415 [Deltaproteobacteria bacterium CG11_big_fil_rev_8_21_14_0_20_47_16]|nr:MAG: hypothetical protein COV45_04415 [Deltaproteobacteria bacterium CG11_big_fil_rev_8_21_14_0_20_47_16]
MLSQHVDVDATTDALAASADSTMSVSCTQDAVAVYVPNVSFTISRSAGTGDRDNQSTYTKSVALTNGINGDTVGSVTVAAPDNNYVKVHLNAPKMKLAGLLCQAENSSALLAKDNDAVDDANLDIFMEASTPTYVPANHIDGSTTNKAIYGSGGLIQASYLKDIDDSESAGTTQDGEVTFGGGSNTTNTSGGFKLGAKFKAFSSNWTSASETLTMTFIPNAI